ncbi:MAG: Zn-ribbon domain-containing OB-fold protein [Chloroflexota bacterium]|nr:Zn-ribbon domain-containing OB-fold protein [Chloroflexota bacterium]
MTQEAPKITPPVPQPESDFYWEKCKEGELWLRHCKSCDKTYFYPRDLCPMCFSRNTDWIQTDGKGTLHTFAIIHRGPTPAFRDKAPYVTAIVELQGGARMPTNLVEIDPDPAVIKCGMALEVTFEKLDDNISLPMFRPSN